jgi:hypothetical protein
VTPQNWLFLKSYSKFRCRLLHDQQVHHVVSVGSGATATASWDVLRALLISSPGRVKSDYIVTGIETDAAKEVQRAFELSDKKVMAITARAILESPSCRISLSTNAKGKTVSYYAKSLQGLSTGDNPRFRGYFWEYLDFEKVWAFQQGVVPRPMFYGGRDQVVRWDEGQGDLVRSSGSAIRGIQALGKLGVGVSQMRSLPATIYSGTFFDTNVAVILPQNQEHLKALFTYCSSEEFSANVRKLDKTLKVTNGTLGEVPFDLVAWQEAAEEKYPNGLPSPHSSDPTQWIFSGDPKNSELPLQTAAVRLLGYKWPRQNGSSFPDCSPFTEDGLDRLTESDGIVPLSSVAGEEGAGARLRALLQSAFGRDYNLAYLLGGKKSATLEGQPWKDGCGMNSSMSIAKSFFKDPSFGTFGMASRMAFTPS